MNLKFFARDLSYYVAQRITRLLNYFFGMRGKVSAVTAPNLAVH